MYILNLLSWKDKEMRVNSDLVLDINGVVLQNKKKASMLSYDIVPEALIREPTATLSNPHSLSRMPLGFHPASLAQLNGLGLWKTTILGMVKAAPSA